MSLRRAHGDAATGGALLVVETAVPDELPVGVPGPAGPVANRNGAGAFRPGAGTRAIAAKGGKAKAEADRFRRLLGLVELSDDHEYAPYLRLAHEHRDAHSIAVASNVGGGQLSPGVLGIIATASLDLAASRYMYDRGARACDPRLLGQAAQIADRSRTALLTAHELAAREATARPRDPAAAHRAVFEAFGSSATKERP